MRKRRILSLLTALALCLSLLPVTALADGKVAAIDDKEYDTLANAIADVPKNAGTPTTIKLLQSFKEDNSNDATVTIPEGTNITLDLRGFTLDLGEGKYGVKLNPGSTFTLTDSRSGGVLKFCGTSGSNRTAIYSDGSSQTINIKGGTVEMTSTDTAAFYAVRATGLLNISGGTLKASRLDSTSAKPIAIGAQGSSLNITGGTIIAERMAGGTRDGAIGIEFTKACTANIADGVEFICTMRDVDVQKQITVTGGKFTNVKFSKTAASGSTLKNCTINGTLTLGSNECTFTDVQFGENAVLDSTRYILSEGSVLPSEAPEITFATNNAAMGLIKIDNYKFSNPSSSGGFSDPMESRTWYVNSGSTATVTATAVRADENHEFVGWYSNTDGSGTPYSTATQVTFTSEGVTENVSYYAVFKETDAYAAMKTAAENWANGESPTITSVTDMGYFAYAVNELDMNFSGKTVTLAADLTYTAADSFTPIGTKAHPFSGIFDGGSNTITGLSAVGTYSTTDTGSYLGLFGYTSGAKIQDLTLSGVDFDGAYMAGGFAGEANSTTFTNCTLTGGSKVSNAYYTGGLFGHSSGGCTVTDCKVENSVLDGKWKTGGITGYADGVTISDTAVNNTEVKGIGVGALIGHANAGNTALTNVTVADVTDGEQKKINVIGTTYEGGNSHSITVSGGSTNIDAAGLVPSDSKSNVQVSGGDFTFVIPDEYVSGSKDKISVTFKNGEEIVIVHVIDRGGTVTLPAAPTKDNCIFKGWYVGVTKITDKTTFTDNTVVNAQWYEIPVSSGGVTLPTHDISVDSGSHGDVEIWPEEAKQGTTVTITATPDKGYEVADVTVTAENGKEITVTDKGNNKYTFMMPGSDVTIAVTFQPVSGGSTSGDLTITAPAGWVNPYTDVAANAWYYDAVGYATANGLMGGVGNNAFDPSGSMNRAMVWTVIARLAGQSISGESWAADARTWAMAQGVSDGTNPDGAVSREELVTMLYRYAGSPAMNVPELALIGNYPDSADVSAWAQNAFAWAISKGIIEGRDGKLAAGEVLTRAEAATILARFHLLTK